jgi:UDP-2-acetamido-3-amino-2,3-dideoxy-glucuronate N-acetyltransferase
MNPTIYATTENTWNMYKNRIHSTADVQTDKIGEGTNVWQNTVILEGAIIGENCNINSHCFIENDVTIGNNVTIKCGVYLWNGVHIGDNVFVGPNASFTNDILPRSKHYPEKFIETHIENGASIGAGAVIIAGVRIGRYAMIGAGGVVTKSVPPYTLWYGNPAQMKGFVCECGCHLPDTLICPQCGKKYRAGADGLEEIS